MELSLLLAQLFGLTLMIFAGVAFWRPEMISAALRDMRPFSFPRFIAGLVGILGGLAIILTHNVWEVGWRTVITVFGWAALLKGVSYILFPERLMHTAIVVLEGEWQRLMLAVTFLLGCYLAYHGFGLGA